MAHLPDDRAVSVLGVRVHATSMDRALRTVEQAVTSREKGYVCVTGVHGVMEAQSDDSLKRILNQSTLTVPDGRPTVWVGWMHGLFEMRQVTGPDLMLQICELSAGKGYRHFFYGGNPGVAEELRDALTRRYPGLNVVGCFCPPFRPLSGEEENALIRTVSELKPDFFWVGLSTPKQEKFMHQYLAKLDTRLMLGVGAAFDIHTGRIKDAPYWMKLGGVQWLHRLYQDPKRLWRRYLINNPKFVYRIALELVGASKREPVWESKKRAA
jgi:N-acetylglucosaminyldiphosphoundecaprenol N-acetyl-beta-D-mannosaminyltransferase